MNLNQTLDYISSNGGATLRLELGGELFSMTDDRWYFAVAPDKTLIVDESRLEAALATFIHDNHIRLLEKDVYLGVWRNPETRRYYIDLNHASSSKLVALDIIKSIDDGSDRRVMSIYNPARQKSVEVNDDRAS